MEDYEGREETLGFSAMVRAGEIDLSCRVTRCSPDAPTVYKGNTTSICS